MGRRMRPWERWVFAVIVVILGLCTFVGYLYVMQPWND
jgi:hypothetical protein